MSAYVVDKDVIDKLIAGALRAKLFGPNDATKKGKMLWRENVVSVSHRYHLPTRDPVELVNYGRDIAAYVFEPCEPSFTEIDEAIDCLDYQSCEHDGWETSAAYALLQELRAAYAKPIKPYVWRGTLNGV